MYFFFYFYFFIIIIIIFYYYSFIYLFNFLRCFKTRNLLAALRSGGLGL